MFTKINIEILIFFISIFFYADAHSNVFGVIAFGIRFLHPSMRALWLASCCGLTTGTWSSSVCLLAEWNVLGGKWRQGVCAKGNMITAFHWQLKGQRALGPRLARGCRIWIHWRRRLAHISPSSFRPLSTGIYSLLWPRACSQVIYFFYIFIYFLRCRM